MPITSETESNIKSFKGKLEDEVKELGELNNGTGNRAGHFIIGLHWIQINKPIENQMDLLIHAIQNQLANNIENNNGNSEQQNKKC
jgi:hypothetical protein